MKNYDKTADYTNIKETLLNDSLGRNKFLFRFISLLQSIEGMNCSIALDAKWGAGKTFFVQQAKLIFDALNPYIGKENSSNNLKDDFLKIEKICKENKIDDSPLQLAVYYNAWENDNLDDPILSLIYSIAQNISTDIKIVEGKRDIGEIVKNIFGLVHVQFSISLNDANKNTLGIDVDGQRVANVVDALHKKKDFGKIENDVKLKSAVNEYLNSLLIEKANRLVIFIDELDRCQPLFAVRLLERVKHYFDNPNITFVFSTNVEELQNTIKTLYGQGFSASRYLDKFFDITLQLPYVEPKDYFSYLGTGENSVWDILKLKIAKNCHLELREINRFIKSTTIANRMLRKTNRAWHDEYYCYLLMDCLSPLLIALRMTNQQEYNSFVNGENPTPIVSLFKDNDETDKILDYWGLISHDTTDLRHNESKVTKLYNSIFGSENIRIEQIGKLRIHEDTKQLLFEITSLLSEYAGYDD